MNAVSKLFVSTSVAALLVGGIGAASAGTYPNAETWSPVAQTSTDAGMKFASADRHHNAETSYPAHEVQSDIVDTAVSAGQFGTLAKALGQQLTFFQSNAEHELVGRVQQAIKDKVAFILLNPAAFTHTSVALRDALAAAHIPFIEVHLSNVQAREPFRKHSYFSDLATGVISGLGAQGYELALSAAIERLKK